MELTFGFQDYLRAEAAAREPDTSNWRAGEVEFHRTAGISGFGAAFSRQNLMINLFDYIGDWVNPDDDPRPVKNMRDWLQQTLDADEWEIVRPWYEKGVFNNVETIGQAEFKVRRLITESNRHLGEDNAHWMTALIGGMGGAILDPTTFIPVGWFGKAGSIAARAAMTGTMLKTIGRGASYKAASQASLQARLAALEARNGLAKGGILSGGTWTRQASEWATVGAVIEGGRELGLSGMEISRTLEESLMNVGAAFIFGGVLGGLFGRSMRWNKGKGANRIDPDHPDSVAPFAMDFTGAVHEGVEGRALGVVDSVTEGIPSSVDMRALVNAHGGADRVAALMREVGTEEGLAKAGLDPKLIELWRKAYGGDAAAQAGIRGFTEGELILPGLVARIPGTKYIGQASKATSRALTGGPWATPLGAMRNAMSPIFRKFLRKALDNGGHASQDELRGIISDAAAESIMELGMFRGFTETMNAIYGPLKREWDEIMAEFTKANPGKKLDFTVGELQDIIRGVLHSADEWKPNTAPANDGVFTPLWKGQTEAARRFREGIMKRTGADEATMTKMFNAAQRNLRGFAEWRYETMKALREKGVVHDTRRAAAFKGEMKRIREEIKAKQKEETAAKKHNKKAPTDQPRIDEQPIRDELEALREQYEVAKKNWATEEALPRDYGNAYGTAQMWDKNVIAEQREKFRQMLLEKFSKEPPEDYLNVGFGLSKDEWNLLGHGTVDIDLTTLQIRMADEGTPGEPLGVNVLNYGKRLKDDDGVLRINAKEGARLKKDITEGFLRAPEENVNGIPMAEVRLATEGAEQAEYEFRQLNRDINNVKGGDVEDASQVAKFMERQQRRVNSMWNETQKYTRLTNDDRRWIKAFDDEEARLSGIPDAEPARPGELIPSGNAPFDITLAKGGERAYDPRGAKTIEDDAAWAALQGKRTQRLNRGNQLEAREKKLLNAQVAWERAVADLAKYADIEARYEAAAKVLRDANLTLKEARRRMIKAHKNRQKKRKGDVVDYVDSVIRHIQQEGVGDKFIKETSPFTDRVVARLRKRQLHLTPDEYLDFTEAGFLRKDVETLIHNEVRQLSGERAMVEAFGLGRQADGTMRTQTHIANEIAADYDELARHATGKEAKRIEAEKKAALSTWDTVRRRIRMEMHPQTNPDSWMQWLTRQMRVVNFMRFVPGFMIGSFTDVAVAGAQNGGVANLLKNGAKGMAFALPARSELGKQNLKTLAMGMEAVSMYTNKSIGRTNRADNVFGRLEAHSAQDITHGGDLGVGSGNVRKFTNWAATQNDRLARFTARWTGMPVWNRTWRYMAGLNMMSNLHMAAKKGWANMTPAEKRWFAKIGMDADDAKEVIRLIRKYGSGKGDELDTADLNWSAWAADGEEAARIRDRFLMAMERHMSRSVIRPGIGETPAFMDAWWGKALFQLQTFAMSFVNRVMRPMAQRAANDEAMEATMTMVHLMWTSAVVVLAKGAMSGKDPTDQSIENFVLDMVDRSGFLGAWSNPLNAGMKLMAPHLSDIGLDFTKTRSRYSQADWFQSLAGVNLGAAAELKKWPQYAVNMDWTKLGKSVHRFLPFNQYTRAILHMAIDD